MVRPRILHNPECSKSRQTLSLLQDRGLEVEVVNYLEAPPSVAELDRVCEQLDVAPLDLFRKREARFAELGLSASDVRPRAEWLQILSDNPILLERPIVIVGPRAAVGRPPENVLGIL